jgi:hypothetical protein
VAVLASVTVDDVPCTDGGRAVKRMAAERLAPRRGERRGSVPTQVLKQKCRVYLI